MYYIFLHNDQDMIEHNVFSDPKLDSLKKIYCEMKKSIAEKLEKNVREQGLVFSYRLSDAWNREIISLEVVKSGNTPKLKTALNKIAFNKTDEKNITDADSELCRSLISTVKKYSPVFQQEGFFIDDPNVYDGFICKIILSDGENVFYFDISNITYCVSSGADALKRLMNEIFVLLKEAGVEEKYLILK